MTCPRCGGPLTVLLVTSVCDRCDPPRGAVAAAAASVTDWVVRCLDPFAVELLESHAAFDTVARVVDPAECTSIRLTPVCLRGRARLRGQETETWDEVTDYRWVTLMSYRGDLRAAVCRQTGEVLAVVQR